MENQYNKTRDAFNFIRFSKNVVSLFCTATDDIQEELCKKNIKHFCTDYTHTELLL